MSKRQTPLNLSREELLALKEKHRTWTAVGERLGLYPEQLIPLKRELDIPLRSGPPRQSQLAVYHSEIIALAAEGANCPQIVRRLNLPVRANQLRCYMRKHYIPLLAKPGAQHGERHHS